MQIFKVAYDLQFSDEVKKELEGYGWSMESNDGDAHQWTVDLLHDIIDENEIGTSKDKEIFDELVEAGVSYIEF